MVIREFREQDRADLRCVYFQSRRDSFTWLNVESFSLADFDRDTIGERIWLCETMGEIVGFISVDMTETYIHHLFVLPMHSGKGYGSALLNKCLENIGRPARLKCLSKNTPALKFYERSGWRTQSLGTDPRDGDYHFMEYGTQQGKSR